MNAKINEYIANREAFKLPGQQILGSDKKVAQIASVYLKHKEDLALIEAALLHDFVNNNEFTSDQLRYFKIGLYSFHDVFKAMFDQIQTENTAREMEEARKNETKTY